MSDSVLHLEAWFTGRVQGVGFRYQTMQIAKEFDVSGSVKNLADGRVHLVAEGQEDQVRGFVKEIQEQMAVFIRDTEIKSHYGAPLHKGFRITH